MIFFWTCLGCGQRWDRVGEQWATNGTATVPRETIPVRAAPLRPKVAAKAKATNVIQGVVIPMPMEQDEFEMVPTLDRMAGPPGR